MTELVFTVGAGRGSIPDMTNLDINFSMLILDSKYPRANAVPLVLIVHREFPNLAPGNLYGCKIMVIMVMCQHYHYFENLF